MRIWFVVYHVIEFVCGPLVSGPVVRPGALKPLVGDGKESSRPLVHNHIIFSLLFSCLVVFVSVIFLYCTFTGAYNNNNNRRMLNIVQKTKLARSPSLIIRTSIVLTQLPAIKAGPDLRPAPYRGQGYIKLC